MQGKKVDMGRTNKIIPYLAEMSFASDFLSAKREVLDDF